jgi:hypothetical protein
MYSLLLQPSLLGLQTRNGMDVQQIFIALTNDTPPFFLTLMMAGIIIYQIYEKRRADSASRADKKALEDENRQLKAADFGLELRNAEIEVEKNKKQLDDYIQTLADYNREGESVDTRFIDHYQEKIKRSEAKRDYFKEKHAILSKDK